MENRIQRLEEDMRLVARKKDVQNKNHNVINRDPETMKASDIEVGEFVLCDDGANKFFVTRIGGELYKAALTKTGV